jgi:hydroxypyruvate reductase
VGKAASAMARAATEALGGRVLGGLVVTKDGHGAPLAGLRCVEASHPQPDARSVAAAARAIALVEPRAHEDVLLVLLSGGASSLLCAPAEGLTLEDKRRAVASLMARGATIAELNTVRKQLSLVKGGRLAAATRARIATVLLCDVPGGDLSVVGSGPTVPNETTAADALAIWDRFEGDGDSPVRRLLARRAGAPTAAAVPARSWDRDVAVVAADNRVLVEAAATVAQERGFDVELGGWDRQGTVQELADELLLVRARLGRSVGSRPRLHLLGGEPTVRLPGDGRCGHGGRAQHVALLLARALAGDATAACLAVGSDGTDGPTDAAGGCVDGATWEAMRAAGAEPAHAVRTFAAYPALNGAAALIKTGATGTNLMDLYALAVVPAPRRGPAPLSVVVVRHRPAPATAVRRTAAG